MFSGGKDIWYNNLYLSADHNHNQFSLEEECFEVSVPTILGESNSNFLKLLWAYRDDHLQNNVQHKQSLSSARARASSAKPKNGIPSSPFYDIKRNRILN